MKQSSYSQDSGSVALLQPFPPVTVYPGNWLPQTEAPILGPTVTTWSLSPWKRLFDLAIAVPAVVCLAVPMLVIALCVRLSSKGPALFAQSRVGRGGRLFQIYKFRSMALSPENRSGPTLTSEGDRRITAVGEWLRRHKLDELPQLFNVLRGEMSLVGPRPKLPEYASVVDSSYLPGLTGASSVAFRSEQQLLAGIPEYHLDSYYNLRIKPLKERIDACYMCKATFCSDLASISKTVLACVAPKRISSAVQFDLKREDRFATQNEPDLASRPMLSWENIPCAMQKECYCRLLQLEGLAGSVTQS
jgi:lipopolysaccharide/colanic/teichoic acid biosynthesis glycosyltransferase